MSPLEWESHTGLGETRRERRSNVTFLMPGEYMQFAVLKSARKSIKIILIEL